MADDGDLPYLLDDEEPRARRKKKLRSRFLHSCGVYSLCISIFYLLAFLGLIIANPPESGVDASLDLVEASLGITGVIISITFLQATNRRHLLAIGCSWLVWMIASFLLSVCALHQLIVEVVSGNDRELLRVAVDTVLTVNAPISIYFILLFASSGGRSRRRRKARKQRQRRQQLAEATAASYPQGLISSATLFGRTRDATKSKTTKPSSTTYDDPPLPNVASYNSLLHDVCLRRMLQFEKELQLTMQQRRLQHVQQQQPIKSRS